MHCHKVSVVGVSTVYNMVIGHSLPNAGEEDGELGELRSKLLHFLQTSIYYNAEMLLIKLPHDSASIHK
jgi:hypothetical protein